jgi:hypothetical protein
MINSIGKDDIGVFHRLRFHWAIASLLDQVLDVWLFVRSRMCL